MFVYQNKAGNICVTFEDNKPVETPEYVIIVDKEAKTIEIQGTTSSDSADLSKYEKQIEELNAAIAEKDAEIERLTSQLEELGKDEEA